MLGNIVIKTMYGNYECKKKQQASLFKMLRGIVAEPHKWCGTNLACFDPLCIQKHYILLSSMILPL